MEGRAFGGYDVEVVDEGEEGTLCDAFGLEFGCPGAEEGLSAAFADLREDDGFAERGGLGGKVLSEVVSEFLRLMEELVI